MPCQTCGASDFAEEMMELLRTQVPPGTRDGVFVARVEGKGQGVARRIVPSAHALDCMDADCAGVGHCCQAEPPIMKCGRAFTEREAIDRVARGALFALWEEGGKVGARAQWRGVTIATAPAEGCLNAATGERLAQDILSTIRSGEMDGHFHAADGEAVALAKAH